jgi:murein DD-endopeptidase MepM/ murein hydrolase activator NlpD
MVDAAAGPVVLALPFRGTWLARNSPARRVPSHGTDLFATTYAMDSGAGALAGNHVILELPDRAAYVLLAHLRRGSVRVERGEVVPAGRAVGACGNSGNSTQPHLHIQVMDGADPYTARGLPMSFRDYRVWPRRGPSPVVVAAGVPGESEIVEPL